MLLSFPPHRAATSTPIGNPPTCSICLTESPTLITLNPCNHTWCPSCLTHIFHRSLSHRTTDFPPRCCPVTRAIPPTCAAPYLTLDFQTKWNRVYQEWSCIHHPQRQRDGNVDAANTFPAVQRPLYCTNPPCNARWIKPKHIVPTSAADAHRLKATCPSCHRQLCGSCAGKWHPGTAPCPSPNNQSTGRTNQAKIKAQKEKEASAQMARLAQNQGWRSCPFCGIWIEKTDGCLHVVCGGCKGEFCYGCGERWEWDHACPRLIRDEMLGGAVSMEEVQRRFGERGGGAQGGVGRDRDGGNGAPAGRRTGGGGGGGGGVGLATRNAIMEGMRNEAAAAQRAMSRARQAGNAAAPANPPPAERQAHHPHHQHQHGRRYPPPGETPPAPRNAPPAAAAIARGAGNPCPAHQQHHQQHHSRPPPPRLQPPVDQAAQAAPHPRGQHPQPPPPHHGQPGRNFHPHAHHTPHPARGHDAPPVAHQSRGAGALPARRGRSHTPGPLHGAPAPDPPNCPRCRTRCASRKKIVVSAEHMGRVFEAWVPACGGCGWFFGEERVRRGGGLAL